MTAATATLDVVPGKLRVPAPRPGCVTRTALVNRLRAARSFPVISVVAPAGYGKTTLLAQWIERDKRPCAWVSVDDRDNDPLVLLRGLAAALDELAPLEARLVEALRRPGRSVWTKLVPRLAEAIASFPTPPIVVLDDVGRLESRSSLDLVSTMAELLHADSTLVLSSREEPDLPIATLRADGRLFEIGTELLALNYREADCLVRATGLDLPDERIGQLLEQTEGWAAALYLAALALHESQEFAGDDRSLVDYVRAEYLTAVSPERLDFLQRTSILEEMTGPLVDAVLDRTGSAADLEEIERANMLVVPLDRRRERFRYHRLFRDLLRHDLALRDPASVASLHARAAGWLEVHGEPANAAPHWLAAGEVDRAAELVSALVLPACERGKVDQAEQWLGLFDDAQLEGHPHLAALSAWVNLLEGREAEALRCLAIADGGKSAEAAVLRAALCRSGPEEMSADAARANTKLPKKSAWRPIALYLAGTAELLRGNSDTADSTLVKAIDTAREQDASATIAAALAQRAVIAAERDEHDRAHELAQEALEAGPPTGRVGRGALEVVLCARALLRCGHWDEAARELRAAEEQRAAWVVPWLAVQTDVEIAWARITLRDLEAARRVIDRAREILQRRPLGTLDRDVADVAVAAQQDERRGRPARLTGAELRLLPLLATHLSFREIGTMFFISRNTVKTQAISVYRKLGVSSRSGAIERAAELGLLDDGAALATVPVRLDG
jgi:LuxR family transcriptional regulator, maltose regulon positive regulatory protein